jgi:hypothetical protein
MKKPVYLRDKTWQWLKETLHGQPKVIVNDAIDRPGRWLLNHGLLERSEILQDTAIEQNPEDGPECLIDELAAVGLSKGFNEVTLFRLGDHKAVVMTREQIIVSIRDGWIFDQIERDSQI